jgi:hypothetical protein
MCLPGRSRCGSRCSLPRCVPAAAPQTARRTRPPSRAASQLSDKTASKLEKDERKPCEEAIFTVDLPAGTEVARARVYVTSASVDVLDGGTLFLEEADDGWEISAAGCKPT